MKLVLAYYCFTPITDPDGEVSRHKAFFEGLDAVGRIYLATQGINGQMSASPEVAEAYMEWMRADSRFGSMPFKIHHYHEHVFPRLTIKTRKQLVALDAEPNLSLGGKRLKPSEWRKMLEEKDEDTLLMDVRNDYEWKIGHFEGAELPKLEKFREFPEYAKALKQERDLSKTRVMMYCTGGIRCELYSAMLREEGFEEVYQLDGGIIEYGLSEGAVHWKGKLFVFDDRLSVPISEKEEAEPISVCSSCGVSSDIYYNCANMDCNAFFLSCPACAEKSVGCCSGPCQEAPRLRSYVKGGRPKPFRRYHLLKEGE